MSIILELKKKKEILSFVTTWMKLEGIMLSEISHKEKNKILYGITDMWNLKEKLNLWKQREEWWLQGLGCGKNRKGLVKGYKLLVIME